MEIINLGGRIVNQYAYRAESGWVLIDTGYEDGYPQFLKALGKHGLTPEQVSYLFLTHAHDDHAGFLTELLRRHANIRAVVSEKSLPGLFRGQNSFEGGCTSRVALGFCGVMKLLGKGAHRFPPLDGELVDRCLVVTDENRAEVGRLLGGTLCDTPGHTSDSISLLLEDGTLFCGDAAMNGLPSLHKITIWAENREDFVRSWRDMIALGPGRICPGHGRPFPVGALEANLPHAEGMTLRPLSPPPGDKLDAENV